MTSPYMRLYDMLQHDPEAIALLDETEMNIRADQQWQDEHHIALGLKDEAPEIAQRITNSEFSPSPVSLRRFSTARHTPIQALVDEWPDMVFLQFDGFDDCVIGYGVSHWREETGVLAYDYESMIRTLVTRDGMTEDEAAEFIEFNTLGAYVGPMTPLVIQSASYRVYEQ